MIIRKIFFVILGILAVSACADKPPVVDSSEVQEVSQKTPQFNELRFLDRPQIKLNAKSIRFVSKYEAPFRAPNVEHLMPFAPERIMRRWAEDRLVATKKGSNVIKVIVNDASVFEENKEGGGLFGSEDKDHYTARLDILIQIIDTDDKIIARATAYSWLKHTIPAKTSLNDREKIWFSIVNKLVKGIDVQLVKAINKYLADYIAE